MFMHVSLNERSSQPVMTAPHSTVSKNHGHCAEAIFYLFGVHDISPPSTHHRGKRFAAGARHTTSTNAIPGIHALETRQRLRPHECKNLSSDTRKFTVVILPSGVTVVTHPVPFERVFSCLPFPFTLSHVCSPNRILLCPLHSYHIPVAFFLSPVISRDGWPTAHHVLPRSVQFIKRQRIRPCGVAVRQPQRVQCFDQLLALLALWSPHGRMNSPAHDGARFQG
jgi:hypothetical protein